MKPELRARLAGLYAIVDDDPRWGSDPDRLLDAVLEGGARVVQLRLKHRSDRERLELARRAVPRARRAGALLIVNDRYDLADLSGSDGVHLGQDDLAPERIPEQLRERLIVGLSTHTLEQVEASRSRPVDYVAFGPVFGTRSKTSSHAPRGLQALEEAVRASAHPVVAIGGVTRETLDSVRATGVVAVAVISAIAGREDPAKATRELVEAFGTPRP